MNKRRFQRKHILLLVLVIICLALIVFSVTQAKRIDKMESLASSDLKYDTDQLLLSCDFVLRNLENGTDGELNETALWYYTDELSIMLHNLQRHGGMYAQLISDDPNYARGYHTSNNLTLVQLFQECRLIARGFNSLDAHQQETYRNFMIPLVAQMQQSFTYSEDAADLASQLAFIDNGWKQLYDYMDDNGIWDDFFANINGLGQ